MSWASSVTAAASGLLIAAIGASGAHAADGPYGIAAGALTGPQETTLTIELTQPASESPVTSLAQVSVQIPATSPRLEVKIFRDVAVHDGVATLELRRLDSGTPVSVQALVKAGKTYVLRSDTTAALRPDLVVTAVNAPPQTLTTRPIDVQADLAEVKGDTPATATVSLLWGPSVLATKSVSVPAGAHISVTFVDVSLRTAEPVELSVLVSDVSPGEYDTTNDSRTATVDVTENELASSRVVLPSWGGYGAQFNNHLYAPITPTPPGGFADLETKVVALEPQLVRIFFNDLWEENANGQHPEAAQNYDSFVKVVGLAQQAGATIEISYQNLGTARLNPGPKMATFAAALEDLVRNHGLTNVRWAEVGNEPNDPNGAVTLDQYNALYRALDAQLTARGLRSQIHLMSAGLVESTGDKNHYIWLKWIGEHMGDVVDAYTEHIYWWYDRPGRLEFRLRDIHRLMTQDLPETERKPMYLMEFGIRGYPNCGDKPVFPNRYYLPDCTEMWRTNIAAFQQFWFNVHAAQLGFTGTSKWDAYQAVYDNGSVRAQLHWLIGPGAEGFPLMPAYYAMSLVFHTTERGWRVIGVDPWESNDWTAPVTPTGETADDTPEKEIAAYAGPNGQLTLLGLDTHGKDLNTVSTDPPSAYSIGGLPPFKTFTLVDWNADGTGVNSVAGTVTTNGAGVARFTVPLQATFALTTIPVG